MHRTDSTPALTVNEANPTTAHQTSDSAEGGGNVTPSVISDAIATAAASSPNQLPTSPAANELSSATGQSAQQPATPIEDKPPTRSDHDDDTTTSNQKSSNQSPKGTSNNNSPGSSASKLHGKHIKGKVSKKGVIASPSSVQQKPSSGQTLNDGATVTKSAVKDNVHRASADDGTSSTEHEHDPTVQQQQTQVSVAASSEEPIVQSTQQHQPEAHENHSLTINEDDNTISNDQSPAASGSNPPASSPVAGSEVGGNHFDLTQVLIDEAQTQSKSSAIDGGSSTTYLASNGVKRRTFQPQSSTELATPPLTPRTAGNQFVPTWDKVKDTIYKIESFESGMAILKVIAWIVTVALGGLPALVLYAGSWLYDLSCRDVTVESGIVSNKDD